MLVKFHSKNFYYRFHHILSFLVRQFFIFSQLTSSIHWLYHVWTDKWHLNVVLLEEKMTQCCYISVRFLKTSGWVSSSSGPISMTIFILTNISSNLELFNELEHLAIRGFWSAQRNIMCNLYEEVLKLRIRN